MNLIPRSSDSVTADTISIGAIRAALARLARHLAVKPSSNRHLTNTDAQLHWVWKMHLFDRVTSTNEILGHLLRRHHSQPNEEIEANLVVVIAREQTKGKGQWARQWNSPQGGLYLSAALSLDCPVQDKALISLSTGWGIASVLADIGVLIGLKWPNDLVVAGKKLGGILIETRLRGDRLSHGVIGVGMNWVNPIPDNAISLHSLLTDQPTCSIQALSDIAALVLLGIQRGMEQWRDEGSGAIASAYSQFLVNKGQHVQVPASTGHHSLGIPGQIVGVDVSGHLVVQVPGTSSQDTSEFSYAPGTIALGYGQK